MGDDLPESWKEYLILGLLKNNKNQNQDKNYRTISLSFSVLKVLEAIIRNRLAGRLKCADIVKVSNGVYKGEGNLG